MKRFFLTVALVVAIALVAPVARPVNVTAYEGVDIPTTWYQTTLTGSSNLSGWDDTAVGTKPSESTILYKRVGDFVLWAGNTLVAYEYDNTTAEDPFL